MTPAFALDLAHDGIRLLHRADGGWTVLGDAALDDPTLESRLGELLRMAEGIAPGEVTTELIIPSSQILYSELPHEQGDRLTDATIRPRLDGMTACPIEEMVFDWDLDGDRLRLAIVDRTTLDEAEAFADAHGFRPMSFSARPDPGDFPRDPDFGATSVANDFETAAAGTITFSSVRTSAPDAPALSTPLTLTAAQRTGPAFPIPAPGAPVADPAPRAPAPLARGPVAAPRRFPVVPVAAGFAIAALIWAGYFAVRTEGPGDPAAVLPDIPPAAATVAPEIAAPDTDAAADPPTPETTRASLPPPAETATPAPAAEPDAATAARTPPEAMGDDNPRLRYAATGIWSEGPSETASPSEASSEDVYVASIDPVTRSNDAIALIPPASLLSEPRPVTPLPPPPAGTVFDLDEDGLVRATPEGAITPDGITVTLGRPALVPPPRPATAAPPAVETGPVFADLGLPDTRPRARPAGIVERNERVNLGGRTRTELAGLQPRPRPASPQVEGEQLAPVAPSDLAVTASLQPRNRPDGLAQQAATNRAVAAALQEDDGEPEVVASAQPDIPTSASVARQATIENAIRLRDLNLIGVYGTDGNRRALVRLPSGRYVKVKVGDRLDGGQIAAIGRDELRYVKGGRNITLKVPSG